MKPEDAIKFLEWIKNTHPENTTHEACNFAISALEKQEQEKWIPCSEKPDYDFQNVLVRWHDRRKGCEDDYYIFEGYVVRGEWRGMFEEVDMADYEPIEWKPIEPYKVGVKNVRWTRMP